VALNKATDEDRARWLKRGLELLPRYHLTDIPCPKCGAPTMTDESDAWLACMYFNDGSFSPTMLPGYDPPKDCDYGEWR
jgi:hypothetical protein